MASSSRRNVAKALGLLCLGGSGAWLFARASTGTSHRSSASANARVRLVLDAPGSASDRDPSDDEPLRLSRAAWLTVAGLSAATRAEVLESISGLLDTLEARALPFGIDLSDESPEAQLNSISARVLPVWTAARALVADGWRTGDGAYRVIAAPGNTAIGNPARAFDPWSEPDRGRIPRAAAFAAWAVSGACLLKTDESSVVAARLRERALNPHSALGLVVDSNIQECRLLQAIDEQSLLALGALRERARRVKLARLGPGGSGSDELLVALQGDLPRPPLLPWLSLRESELLVVPRLQAAGRPSRLSEEVYELTGLRPA